MYATDNILFVADIITSVFDSDLIISYKNECYKVVKFFACWLVEERSGSAETSFRIS